MGRCQDRFRFSVPSVIPEEGASALKKAAEGAGFAANNGRHKVPAIRWSEAEAAAVCAMKEFVTVLKVLLPHAHKLKLSHEHP